MITSNVPTNESIRLQASLRTLASTVVPLSVETHKPVVSDDDLLTPLQDARAEIRKAYLDSCREELARLDSHPEQQDTFLQHLLEICFTPHRPELSETYASLLQLITDTLLNHPYRYEHHRSLLLLGATNLQSTQTHAPFVLVLNQTLKSLAKETSHGDTLAVQHIQESQKLRAYTTPGTSQDVLEIYLEADRNLTPDQVGGDLLDAYTGLLAQAPNPGPVLHLLLDNLRAWLHDAPQRGRLPPQLLLHALRAARGDAWDTLAPPLRRQLLIGRAMVGRPSMPGGLLSALQHHYTYIDDLSIALRIMDLLARLPTTRARIPEICDYLSDPRLQSMPPSFWSAALDLLNSLATGLAQNPSRPLFAPDMERLVKPQRATWQIGTRDVLLRGLLKHLANSVFLSAELRLQAWQILLNTLPQDQNERWQLYAESLATIHDLRLASTLKVATANYQREVWQHVTHLWLELTAGNAQTDGRAERLRLVCRLYTSVRDPEAVTHKGNSTPLLLSLALDDPDPDVRAATKQALDDAKLRPVLEYEEQRRRLNNHDLEALHLEREERDLTTRIEQNAGELEHILQILEHKHQHAVDNLGLQLSLLDSERRSIETNLHTCESQLARHQQTIQNLDSRLDNESISLAAERDQLDQLIELQANLAVETTRLEGHYADLYSEREQVRRRLERLPEHSTRFQKHREWMEWSFEKLGHYERQITSNSRQARLTQLQMDQARERHLLLTSSYETLQRERRRHQRQFDTLHGIAEQQRRKLSQVRVGIEQLHAEEQRLLAEHQQQTGQIRQVQRQTEEQSRKQERIQVQLNASLRDIQLRRNTLDIIIQAGQRRAIELLDQASAAIRQADQQAEEEQIRHENALWVEQELFVCYCSWLEQAQGNS